MIPKGTWIWYLGNTLQNIAAMKFSYYIPVSTITLWHFFFTAFHGRGSLFWSLLTYFFHYFQAEERRRLLIVFLCKVSKKIMFNCFDFSIITPVFSLFNIHGFDVKALRAFRVLRPLRLVSRAPSKLPAFIRKWTCWTTLII